MTLEIQSNCIDQEVIEALTDTEQLEAFDRINNELNYINKGLNYRQTDFIIIDFIIIPN